MNDDTFAVHLESKSFSCEDLHVRKLTGTEAISQLFSFDLEVVCADRGGIDLDAMEGAPVAIVFEEHGLEVRRVHGMIAEIDDRMAAHAAYRLYHLRIVPRAFRMTLTELQDIFMDATVPDIVKKKLELVGLGGEDIDLRLLEKYPRREFVVQYKETDLAFVSRLSEHLGISFFFDHEGDHDRMVFTDNPAGFALHEAPIPFYGGGEARGVFDLRLSRRLVPSVYVVRDYNYRQPVVDLTSEHEIPSGYAGGIIEHGAHFKTPEEGKALARIRAEERLATRAVYTGKSVVSALGAGTKVRIDGHPDLADPDLLIVEIDHHATFPVAFSGKEERPGYSNAFRAVRAQDSYRPPRRTPRPRIAGLVTAIVDPGPNGTRDHAQLDDQGRYTVRFLFDPTTPGERRASRPVRMAQPFAGEDYGMHFPLKPGIEVVVGFIDGDPDRPIIVGALPNPLKPSPVNSRNPRVHRIKTASGIRVDMTDGR